MKKKIYYFFLALLPILAFVSGGKIIWIYNIFLILLSVIYLRGIIPFSRIGFLLLMPILCNLSFSITGDSYLVSQSLFYLLTPFLFLWYGMQLSAILSKKKMLLFIIYSGTATSVLYLGTGLLQLGLGAFYDIYALRNLHIADLICSVISVFILLMPFTENNGILIKSVTLRNIILFLNVTAIILSGSRTYYISCLLFLFIYLFYYNKKIFIIGFITLSGGLIFLLSLNSDDSLFIYKIQHSISETDIKRKIDTYEDANQYYRGYEGQMVLKEFNRGASADLLLGTKMDHLIPLDFYIKLGEEFRNSVPIVHNGYLYLLRLGVLGCFFFLLFWFSFFRKLFHIKRNKFYYCLFLSTALTLLFSNYVITSFFTVEMFFAWIIIGYFITKYRIFSMS